LAKIPSLPHARAEIGDPRQHDLGMRALACQQYMESGKQDSDKPFAVSWRCFTTFHLRIKNVP
jgi:hypothetical protein